MTRKQSFVFSPADGVPPQVGPFSHAVRFGNLEFVTGQMPTDPATGQIVQGGVVAGLSLGWRDIADGSEQAAVVEPVDPFEGGELHCLEALPWPAPVDHLGLEQAVDGLGEGVVIGVADAADRGLDLGLGKTVGVAQREVLRPAVRMVHKLAADRPPLVQRLFQGIQHEAGVR